MHDGDAIAFTSHAYRCRLQLPSSPSPVSPRTSPVTEGSPMSPSPVSTSTAPPAPAGAAPAPTPARTPASGAGPSSCPQPGGADGRDGEDRSQLEDLSQLRVVPARHPGRVLLAVVVGLLVAAVLFAFVT